jgi:hypothetical protein
MVMSILTQGQQILSLKSTDTRNKELCDLVANSMDGQYIGTQLLGGYAQSADTAGVKLFFKEMPSIAVTKLIANLGKAQGASVDVDSSSTDNGDGTYSVGVTLHQSNGSSYDATIILDVVGKSYRIMDGTYLGFSGINYLSNQVQKQIDSAANTNPNAPVSEFMKEQMADPNFIMCN